MTNVTRAIKRAFVLIGTGTATCTVYAVATHTSVVAPLMLGCGAVMGLGLFMALHTQEQNA